VTKVWRKSVNRYWRYRGNIKLPRESRTHGRTDARTHGRTTRKHTASAGAYRRRRLKKQKKVHLSFLIILFTNIFMQKYVIKKCHFPTALQHILNTYVNMRNSAAETYRIHPLLPLLVPDDRDCPIQDL